MQRRSLVVAIAASAFATIVAIDPRIAGFREPAASVAIPPDDPADLAAQQPEVVNLAVRFVRLSDRDALDDASHAGTRATTCGYAASRALAQPPFADVVLNAARSMMGLAPASACDTQPVAPWAWWLGSAIVGLVAVARLGGRRFR